MSKTLTQILVILVLAVILGAARNVAAPGGIPWVGQWVTEVAEGDSAVVPASAEEGDPPFITLEEAQQLHADPDVVFLDAREPEDYETGSIPGSILLPFEHFDNYWPAVEPKLFDKKRIVTYCSGSECDLSLFLARVLVEDFGYQNVSIFFGGSRMWHDAGLPMDTLAAPEGL